jgi:glucans biosynthesis protein
MPALRRVHRSPGSFTIAYEPMSNDLDRRQFTGLLFAAALAATAAGRARAASAAGPDLGPAKPFSFDALAKRAAGLARAPFVPAPTAASDVLNQIDYDAFQKIKFRRDRTLQIERDRRHPVQLFHMGKGFLEPVRIHVVEDGQAREVRYTSSLFDSPPDHPARQLPDGLGFAGFRVMAENLETDWLAFLGASYFRSSGPFNQYGLSARALAIDTGLPTPEEFPRFSEFYLSAEPSGPLIIYALLDSPSVAGAYRFSIERLTDSRDIHRVVMDIEARLFARRDITRLGIAPFSSMFWYGESSRKQAADWRPEIHDSDGLALHLGNGERLWRPLNNPPTVMTNAFQDKNPKGFGLLQRDRDFVHYLDDGVFYERRASTWVEPQDDWGEGAVHLLEIPTDDEIHDNIAAYWCPAGVFKAGENRTYRYRLSWLDDIAFPDALARATNTWTGLGGRPGHKRPQGVRKFVIDFQGQPFASLGRNDGVELVVTPSRGKLGTSYNHPVVDQRNRWRAVFDLEAQGREPVDIRAFLQRNGTPLTETWIYQYFPED